MGKSFLFKQKTTFLIILLIIFPHIFGPSSYIVFGILIFGSFVLINIIGWTTAIRNIEKGTFSLNPFTQWRANANSDLNEYELLLFKYSLIIISSAVLSFIVYALIN